MRKRDRERESARRNSMTYLLYYNRLREYAINMFKWEGLPDSVNERFLETKMYEEGRVVFYEDKNLGGFLALPVQLGHKVNVYMEPTSYRAYSMNHYKELTPDEAVVMWNNYSRTPIDPIVVSYAERLYEITRTQDVNVKAQKTPVLIKVSEQQRMSLEQVYMHYDGNEPVIFGNKDGFDPDSIDVLKTDAPYVADKLQVLKNEIWNEAMTFLGVGNAKQDKKERLVADEVSANDEQIQGAREIMLRARQEACEQINKMFGLNVSVKFRLEQPEEEEAPEDDPKVPKD